MADDHIRYDILAQEALRGVMRKVLAEVARTGLPGNHHFFITFRTDRPGVAVPDHLRARYPDEMTVVLQHQYSDLEVSQEAFSVTLTFAKMPSRLVVPFAAITRFVDPPVNFGLQLTPADENGVAMETASPEPEAVPAKDDDSGEPKDVALDSFRKT